MKGWRLTRRVAIGACCLALAGCTITFIPPGWKSVAAPQPGDLSIVGNPGAGGHPGHHPPFPHPNQALKTPGPSLPPNPLPVPSGNIPIGFTNEAVTIIISRLQALEEGKKVAEARLQFFESRDRDRDRLLQTSGYELEESARFLRTAKSEIQRLKQQLEDMRTRQLQSDRDNRTQMESLLRTIDQFLEKDR